MWRRFARAFMVHCERALYFDLDFARPAHSRRIAYSKARYSHQNRICRPENIRQWSLCIAEILMGPADGS